MDHFPPESEQSEKSTQEIMRFPEPELPTVLSEIVACRHGANLALALFYDGLPGQTLAVLRDLRERLEYLMSLFDPEAASVYGPPTITSGSILSLTLMSSEKSKYRLQVLEELIRANLTVVEERSAAGVEARDDISATLMPLLDVLRAEVRGATDSRQGLYSRTQ